LHSPAVPKLCYQLGWVEGRNVRIETVWAGGSYEAFRKHAVELVASAPDVILADGSTTVAPLLMTTSTVPIVSVTTIDPSACGWVESLSRPGTNATGLPHANSA
jgi:putative ABC transport system substrate-binding protein